MVGSDGVPYAPESIPEAYNGLVKFDMKRWEQYCTSNHIPIRNPVDIGAVGYWTETGYTHPINEQQYVRQLYED